jgi:hypothetical protein
MQKPPCLGCIRYCISISAEVDLVARDLRYNTPVQVTVGPFRDKTDGVTIKNSLTISNERITLTADTDDGNAPTIILDNVVGATSGTNNDLNNISRIAMQG